MVKKITIILLLNLLALTMFGQRLKLNSQVFEMKNVTGSIIEFQGEKVLKIERDLKALPFDMANLGALLMSLHTLSF